MRTDFGIFYPKKLGLIKRNMIHDTHNKIKAATTFHIRDFHSPKFLSLIHPLIIIIHHITTKRNEKINIAVMVILLSDHISLGNALIGLILESELIQISIQSHINGTTVFSWIPQHHLDGSQTHLPSHLSIFHAGQTHELDDLSRIFDAGQVHTISGHSHLQQDQLVYIASYGHLHSDQITTLG